MALGNILYQIRHWVFGTTAVRENAYKVFYKLYHGLYLPVRVRSIRKKKEIRVCFLLSELGVWKTEALYLMMKDHERFCPFIVCEPVTGDTEIEKALRTYLKKKDYEYITLGDKDTLQNKVRPDIILYQRPYGCYTKKNEYYMNLRSVFCHVQYAFHTIEEKWTCDIPFLNICWQVYYENKGLLRNLHTIMGNGGHNCIVTGLPMTDVYLQPKKDMADPWKPQNKPKKRIIYAPHHTISNQEWIHFSTFLQYYDFMLTMAEKYKEQVQFAFKPHPSLRRKLNIMWGKEKTDAYFAKWKTMENTQYEDGEYVSLFMHSDALIHDCSSFIIEYQYTQNSALYLIRENTDYTKNMTEFSIESFELHEKAKNEHDIEMFILAIIREEQLQADKRKQFYEKSLLPPNNKTACENICNAILGISQ